MEHVMSVVVVLALVACTTGRHYCCMSQELPAASTGDSRSLCCRKSKAPVMLREPLRFCSSTGLTSCCSKVEDAVLESIFLRAGGGKNVPDEPQQASILLFKSSLCTRCMPAITNSSCADTRPEQPHAHNGVVYGLISVGVAMLIAITIFYKILHQGGGRPHNVSTSAMTTAAATAAIQLVAPDDGVN